MKRKRVLPLCLGALFVAVPAMSQEKTSITLEDLVRASVARNRSVLALRQRIAQAQGLTRQAGVRPCEDGPSEEDFGQEGTREEGSGEEGPRKEVRPEVEG